MSRTHICIIFFIITILFATTIVSKSILFDHYSNTLGDHYEQPLYLFDDDHIIDYYQRTNNHHLPPIFMPQQALLIDLHWISNIQYIGKYLNRELSPDLLPLMQSFTNLAGGRYYPYVFTQLIGPYAKNSPADEMVKRQSRLQTIALGKKGADLACTGALADGSGCPNHELAQFLAFNYYYYLQQGEESAKWYEQASRYPHAPPMLVNMPAIVKGSLGQHLKSVYLRFDKYQSIQTKNEKNLTPELIKQLQTYLYKAVYEYTLHLITQAEKNAVQSGECLHDLGCLQNKGYLSDQIQSAYQHCQSSSGKQSVICKTLMYALNNKFIQLDGTLVYPLNTVHKSFNYVRHPVQEKWRILPQTKK